MFPNRFSLKLHNFIYQSFDNTKTQIIILISIDCIEHNKIFVHGEKELRQIQFFNKLIH